MNTGPSPYTLLDHAYMHLTRELCRALPPPRIESEREDRDKAAIAQVASLQPDNTAEFQLAALFVEESARAQHCQTLADEPGLPPTLALKWTGKADLMMRQASAAMRSLLRLQANRSKIEADPKAYDRGERIEHTMTVLMTQALETDISRHDPESQNSKTEILPRQLESTPIARDPGTAHHDAQATAPAPPNPEPHPVTQSVSSHDPKSHSPKTEIPTRHPKPAPTKPWRPLRPGYDFPLSDLTETEALEDAT